MASPLSIHTSLPSRQQQDILSPESSTAYTPAAHSNATKIPAASRLYDDIERLGGASIEENTQHYLRQQDRRDSGGSVTHERFDILSHAVSTSSSIQSRQISTSSSTIQDEDRGDAFNLEISVDPPELKVQNDLPTYEELREHEGGGENARFGRWRGWIEKRARERLEEREEARRAGKARKGWDLEDTTPPPPPLQSQVDTSNVLVPSASSPSRTQTQAQLPDYSTTPPHNTPSPEPSSSLSIESGSPAIFPQSLYPTIKPPPGVIPLTPSSSIHPIGSRFLQQIPEQPLCATSLPTVSAQSRRRRTTLNCDRFILIGTRSSLWAVDLFPTLGKNEAIGSVSVENARCVEVWSGLGVLQLEVFLEEPPRGRKDAVSGVVIGLVAEPEDNGSGDVNSGNATVKMWPLQSLVNLAKWRTFAGPGENEPLDLGQSVGVGGEKRERDKGKRRSALNGLKKLWKEQMPIEVQQSLAEYKERTLKRSNSGSGRTKLGHGFGHDKSHLRQVSTDLTPFMLDSSLSTTTGIDNRSTSVNSTSPLLSSSFSTSSSAPNKPSQPRTLPRSLPPSFPTTSQSLPSSQPSSDSSNTPDQPHSFLPLEWATNTVQLSPPQRNYSPVLFFKLSRRPATWIPANEDGTVPSILKAKESDGGQMPGWIYLSLVTRQHVFLFESRPATHRTWQIVNEFYAPFVPTFVDVVRVDPKTGQGRSRTASVNSSISKENSDSLMPDELYLFLGMSEKAVVVRLSDSSVREVEAPRLVTHKRGTTRQKDRSAPSPGHLPMHRMSRDEPLRRNSDSDLGRESKEVWSGCEQIILQIPSGGSDGRKGKGRGMDKKVLRPIYVVTYGRASHLVRSPLSCVTSEASSPNLSPPIKLRPLHTFVWNANVDRVIAFLPPPSIYNNTDCIRLVLTAFTPTGVQVQEGTIPLSSIPQLDDKPGGSSIGLGQSHMRTPFFIPLRSCSSNNSNNPAPNLAQRKEWKHNSNQDSELDGLASYDLGTNCGFLCKGGPWWNTIREQPSTGMGLVTIERGEINEGEGEGESADSLFLSMPAGAFWWARKAGDWRIFWVG